MTTQWTWPAGLEQMPNLVEIINDPSGIPHVVYGPSCDSTERQVPRFHGRTKQVIGITWEDGHRSCGNPAELWAFEMDDPDDGYMAVYRCPEHS